MTYTHPHSQYSTSLSLAHPVSGNRRKSRGGWGGATERGGEKEGGREREREGGREKEREKEREREREREKRGGRRKKENRT